MADLKSYILIEYAEIDPNGEDDWFADPAGWDAYGYVFDAIAYAQPWHLEDEDDVPTRALEITRRYIVRKGDDVAQGQHESQFNLTVKNLTNRAAPYTIWWTLVPPGQ